MNTVASSSNSAICSNICYKANVFFCCVSLEIVEEGHGAATPEEISSLEEFIPTRLTCLTLLSVSVTVSMAEFNLLHTLMPVIMGCKVVHTDFILANNILRTSRRVISMLDALHKMIVWKSYIQTEMEREWYDLKIVIHICQHNYKEQIILGTNWTFKQVTVLLKMFKLLIMYISEYVIYLKKDLQSCGEVGKVCIVMCYSWLHITKGLQYYRLVSRCTRETDEDILT